MCPDIRKIAKNKVMVMVMAMALVNSQIAKLAKYLTNLAELAIWLIGCVDKHARLGHPLK